MPLRFEGETVFFEGACGVEEAVGLAEWLTNARAGAADLSRCTGLHTALLQCLLAGEVRLGARPEDPFLDRWVAPLLGS